MRTGFAVVRRMGPTSTALVVALLVYAPAAADCRSAETPQMAAGLPLDEAFRTRTMGLDAPTELFGKAIAQPGKVFAKRDGNQGQAVLVAPVSAEAFWMAINDDDHHDDESGYIPLRLSRVIEGERGASGRRTFQYFKKAGLGRWWVNELTMNADLYHATDGRMWELSWKDVLADYPADSPPVTVDEDVQPLVQGLGAWVLYPLGEECVLVEYATEGEPGGLLGTFQFLVATRAVRTTLTGMLAMARDHLAEDHSEVRFVRPDGRAVDAATP